MNSVIDAYLTFKIDNIIEYIKILSEEKKVSSRIPRTLNKLIYKYYDLFVLSKKEVDYEKLKLKTGLDDTKERLILFYLLIEFDMTSKTELSEEKLYNFYNFIVNSIIVFTDLEKTISKNKEHYSYDDSIKRILKKYEDYLDVDFLILLDAVYSKLDKKYCKNQVKELRFKESQKNDNFKLSLSKIKNSEDLYLSKFKFNDERLENESKKDIELIRNEFAVKLNFINIEMIALKVVEESFTESNEIVFVNLEDEIITKKTNLSNLEKLLDLRVLKEKICLIVNTSILEKYEDRINYLINEEFNFSYQKNTELVKKDIYKHGNYLFVEYDNLLNDEIEFAKDNNLELIVKLKSRLSQEELNKLGNIKYIS